MKLSNADLISLMTKVADASLYYPEYRYKAWGYGEWIAMEGLIAASEITGNRGTWDLLRA